MTHDRAVLLKPAPEEDLLAGGDLLLGEDDLAVGAHDLRRQRHRVRVGAIRKDSHDQEPEDQDEGDALHPSLGDRDLRLRRLSIHTAGHVAHACSTLSYVDATRRGAGPPWQVTIPINYAV